MASASGGTMRKKKIQFSSMKQPPLIKQLKGILSEYPDGGQILKELIQNAEDAGAREVRILHDKRMINQDTSDQTSTRTKFFKGPALCLYNDAVFTENDWEGIKMIYSSVKEEDPMKVGRFGLGFKSVFHITDFPCVISGDTLLMIDPQQPQNSVNATLELCALDEYSKEEFDADAFWVALEDTFGLSRHSLDENGFKGTIFWFPLREKPSDLSETLYNENKVNNLFDSFSLDASDTLLFLKNIEKISLHSRDLDRTINESLKIEIEDKDGHIRHARQEFKDKIKNHMQMSECADLHSTLHLIIRKLFNDTEERQEWLVVNYFVRESASHGFQKLIQDKNLGYSPYVGVAAPLGEMEEDFEGHVFCFLPLPKEGERLTGLPVHVNGFFALSQNRHHMKWVTDEQEGKPIDDKSILWNQALMEEALPKAYELLILEVIEMSKKNVSDDRSVKAVYNAMPTCKTTPRRTHKRWMKLESKLYDYLSKRKMVYAIHTKEWIYLRDACFATFRTGSGSTDDIDIQKSVLRCLSEIGMKYADVPLSLHDTFQAYFPFIKDLTPEILATQMKQRQEYKSLSCSDKLNVTRYLLLNNNNSNVQDIELLPLASTKWTSFSKSKFSEPVYICSDEALKMFPRFENKFVMESMKLGPQLTEALNRICESGCYQVQRLNVDMAKHVMKETLSFHLGSGVQLTKATSLSHHWLENVWNFIVDRKMVKIFKDVTLVPVLVQGSWTDPDVIELVSLSEYLIIKDCKDIGETCLNEGLIYCLKALKVKVLPSLPDWINFESIQEFVKRPTKEDIASLLDEMYKKIGDKIVTVINTDCNLKLNSQMRETFLHIGSPLINLQPNLVKLFRKLDLFKAVRSMEDNGIYTSIADVDKCITDGINFPAGVDLPYKCLKIGSQEQNIIKKLQIQILSQETLISQTVKSLQASKDQNQVKAFMKFFLKNFYKFENDISICENAAKLTFLKVGKELCKPSDVFDPSSHSLQRLLIGESLFPEGSNEFISQELRALRRLGMKGKEKIDGIIMLKVATTLSAWVRNGDKSDVLLKKANEFMETLVHHPELLDQNCKGKSTLGKALMQIQCIPVYKTQPVDYPNGMPWLPDTNNEVLCRPSDAKHMNWSLYAGAILPMVNCSSDKVIGHFRWNESPKTEIILQQLAVIRQYYNVQNKPDYVRATQKIYKHLYSVKVSISNLHFLKDEKVIWTGESFEKPCNVIITKQKADLDLRPYYHSLPEEFQDINALFQLFGCNLEQSNEILLTTLNDIKSKHESADTITKISISKDSNVVLEILKSLARRQKDGMFVVEESKQLMLVENQSSDKLSLQYVSFCIFDDDQDELDIEEEKRYFVVHHSIPVSVAKDLGVKSLKKKTIIGATEELGVEDWGLHESLTTRIRTLLKEGYKDGLSVPKELVQNADDSGATVVKFLYDERQNNDAQRTGKLLTSELIKCQGPALWVFNDSLFTEQDLNNITKLNGATKADRKDKIGKFGLGFCSVYNLTDVPSFISGKDMVIFDPHETYLNEVRQSRVRGTGLRIKLSNQNIIRRNADQFKPYNAVFGCNVSDKTFTGFSGTLFRFPLRTEYQAASSEICSEVYSKDEVTSLLNQFVENAGNILLFTQNVKILQMYHLPKNETDPSKAKLLFKIEKQIHQSESGNLTFASQNILGRMPTILGNKGTFAEIQNVNVRQNLFESTLLNLRHSQYASSVETNWILSWAIGTKKSLELAKDMSKERAVPLSSVAIPLNDKIGYVPLMLKDVPVGFYKKGHLFCFLPLPISTDMQVYINGCFSVSSDRRCLACFTEDDKRKGQEVVWNQALLEDSVTQSFVNLLYYLSEKCSESYNYYSLWPQGKCDDIKSFSRSFYRKLIKDKLKLFRGEHAWLSFNEVIYLDPVVRCNSVIGDIAFDFLTSVPFISGKQIIEIPRHILSSLQDCLGSNSVIRESMINEEMLMLHLLNSLDSPYWKNEKQKRNKLIFHALQSKNTNVFEKLKATKCIPTQPNNNLCKPNELISPTSDIAEMFEIADEKFPLKSDEFPSSNIFPQLIALGMNTRFLPCDMLLNRCKTIDALIDTCCWCAQERSTRVLKYCGRSEVIQKIKEDPHTLKELQQTLLMPVLSLPNNWQFTWKADSLNDHVSNARCSAHLQEKDNTIRFQKPTLLFRENFSTCNGSVSIFVDESNLRRKCALPVNLFKLLGVKCQLSFELLLNQLVILSEEYSFSEKQFLSLDKITRAVYDELGKLTGDKSEEEIVQMQCFQNLRLKPLILIGKDLVLPCKVAFNVKSECTPELYHLKEADYKKKKLFKAFGVKEHFQVDYLTSVLQRKYTEYYQRVCTDIDIVSSLLLNLCESMKIEKICYSDLINIDATVVAPDLHGFLRPTCDLIIEDPAYKSSETLHILHGNIPPDIGRALGVKSKQRKIVELFSSGFFEPFGQNESLVTRLTGILEDYPCDSSIMKELIQNADDAGATEIVFIKNYKSYPTKKMFGSGKLQEPSLCVFNDSYFTEDDFKGIRNLGIGSKREDPSKTGQYGIGFNAVYHLTDTPSFLTKGPGLGKAGQICIFDPLMTCLKDHATAENPGIKCDAHQMNESFPDMLLGYPKITSIELSRQGTMFRLPFRKSRSDISKNIMTPDKMDKMIEAFKEDMFECLLFLKSVKCIKVLRVENEDLIEEFSVDSELSDEDAFTRKQYFSRVKEVLKANMNAHHQNLCLNPIEASYKINISDKNGKNESWLIINRFGIKQTHEQFSNVVAALKAKDIGLTPTVAIAFPWPDGLTIKLPYAFKQVGKLEKFSGKAFCFLPLPISTGLPFHVNGHFALDKARTKLWSEGDRKSWNDFVISELLSRTCISAIHYVKDNFILQNLTELVDDNLRKNVLEKYHSIFPQWEKSLDNSWKTFISSFYQLLVEEESRVFPSIGKEHFGNIHSKHTLKELKINWVPLAKSEHDFQGTFNVVSTYVTHDASHLSYPIKDSFSKLDAKCVEYSIRKVGMKIIETPLSVKHSLYQSGVKYIPICSPQSVIMFLQTFDDDNKNTCDIGKIDCQLVETTISNISALRNLLKYINIDRKLISKIDRLPLCLTNNGILQVFSTNTPLFCSNMCNILTGSAERFIHHEIIPLVDSEEYYTAGVIKTFNIEDFRSIIAQTFDPSVLATGSHVNWNKEKGDPLKANVVKEIFSFIHSQSLAPVIERSAYISFDKKLFHRNIHTFNSWSFIPSVNHFESRKIFELVPICQTNHLVKKSLLIWHSTLNTVIDKLNIPQLDESCFTEGTENLKYELMDLLPSTERPVQLLECLYFYNSRFRSKPLTQKEAISVLYFFEDKIEQMSESCNENDLRSKFRSLPLYLSHQEDFVSIENFSDVIVLPTGIPSTGINDWAQATGILLLKDTEKLQNLYKFLRFPRKNVIEVYAETILPYFHKFPRTAWKVHIEYIKNEILKTSCDKTFNQHQSYIVSHLKTIAFIRVFEEYKRVDQLYDHKNTVFSCMLSEDHFLPEEYREEKWMNFLETLGLIMKPTGKMLYDFAQRISATINRPINETTIKQSEALVICLFSNDWPEKTLDLIKNVRFVVPKKVDKQRKHIAQQPGNGDLLISLCGAVSFEFMDLCWSTENLIPFLPPAKQLQSSLGIKEHPSMDQIVKHCQNVSEVFMVKFQKNDQTISTAFVKKQMELLYNEFQNSFNESMKRSFQVTPLVFQPDDKMMLLVRQVVVNLNDDEEIRPYLYKLPNCFGPYAELFQKLGANKKPLCSDYSFVLAEIKRQFKEMSLPPNILLCVKKALTNIIRLVEKETTSLNNVDEIFLPDENSVLISSKMLTVSNNNGIRERLEGRQQIHFFMGFKELGIDVRDPAMPFEKWPADLQPDILTKEVVEEVSTDSVVIEDSITAQRIECSLRSAPVIQGILRLLKHQFKDNHECFDSSSENFFMERLKNVCIKKVSGLITFLNYKGERVAGTDLNASCFIKSHNTRNKDDIETTDYELYFQKDTDDPLLYFLLARRPGILDLIDLCLNRKLDKYMTQNLSQILQLLDRASEISPYLDKLNIEAYDLPSSWNVSVFPKPGTYVEEKFHAFLEQNISPFKIFEYTYVALEMEEENDLHEPVYMYANIMKENKRCHGGSLLDITYNVNVGCSDDLIAVPIYRLYRFKAKTPEEVMDLDVYDIEPIGSLPIDENFRRVRQILKDAWRLDETGRKSIIRRLWIKWHPDRNREHQEYAGRLFNYVNEVIKKLENNEAVDDDISSDTGKVPTDMSNSAYGLASHKVYQRGSTLAAHFHDNRNDYMRSTRTGNFAHQKAEKAVVRHIGEAKRWHRQAVQDYKAANTNISTGEEDQSFNWVCYKCHQASEKALKAAWFAKNANMARQKDHSLTKIANGLDDGILLTKATDLESITGDYSCMRYPDSVRGYHQIPSEMFDCKKAEKALEITKCILDMTAELID